MCDFCDAYRLRQDYHRKAIKREEDPLDRAYKQEITVAMVIRNWFPGRKRNAGTTTDYRYRGCGYKLNYCPECGKNLKRK